MTKDEKREGEANSPPPFPLEALREEYMKRQKFRKKVLPVAGGVLTLLLLLSSCVSERMGALPGEKEKEMFAKLPYYNSKTGKFCNEEKVVMHLPRGVKGKWGLFRFIFTSENAPGKDLPIVKLSRRDFPPEKDAFSVRWLGHSTLILEMEGLRFMTDPVFGNAAPLPGVLRRYGKQPLPIKELPELDFVLISHDHYDHLEYSFIRKIRFEKFPVICPYGVGARLRSWGIGKERIKEIGWWESINIGKLKITATPARHFSGRSWSDRDQTLWASYVIEGKGKKVFFGGDSGYGRHFAGIGKKFGPFDLVCMEIDAWNEKWPNNHIFPHEIPKAVKELKGKLFLPIHWGVFDMARHKWDLSIEMLMEEVKKSAIPCATPKMGEKFFPASPSPSPIPSSFWWKEKK